MPRIANNKDDKDKEKKNKVKKDSKKKEKKLKIYCGIENPIPSGYRLGSMQECFDAGKVMYYGIKTVDSIVLNSKKKIDINDINSLQIRKAGLVGKHKNLKNKLEKATTLDEKQNIIKELESVIKEINSIGDQILKLKK